MPHALVSRRRSARALAAVTALLLATLAPTRALAQSRTPPLGADAGARPVVLVVARGGTLTIDGRLDEAAWQAATPITSFTQRFPNEGDAPSQRTEVRVLHDDAALYVGARLLDTAPDGIRAPLGRRDAALPADGFAVYLDSDGNRRTAFVFRVAASGSIGDALVTNGIDSDDAWDAVWASAVRRDSAGWYAELRIPFSQLRVQRSPAAGDSAASRRWGINFVRWIARTNEELQWSLVPRQAAVAVPYYGELRGLALGDVPRALEVVPFVVGQVTTRDAFARAGGADVLSPAMRVGADLRLALTPRLRLSAALNPDFGQVEADPSVVNLTAYEVFFQERRPFFLEGADIFQSSVSDWFDDGQLFYSRRIGRAPQGVAPGDASLRDVPAATTILGAAKVSGQLTERWTGGALAVVTAEEEALTADDAGARRLIVEPATSHAVVRAQRGSADGRTVLGLLGTSVARRLDDAPALATLRAGAHVGGVDLTHRFGGDRFELRAFAYGSHVTGGRAAIAATQRSTARLFQRPDAEHLALDTTRTSLDGAAAMIKVGKYGGSWRWQQALRGFSPGFEANDLGFQPRADYVVQFANVGYESTRETRFARNGWAYFNQWSYWTTGREFLGADVELDAFAQMRGWWTARLRVLAEGRGLSVEALRGGPAMREPPRGFAELTLTTDPRAGLSGTLRLRAERERDAGGRRSVVAPSVVLRPSPRLDLSLGATAERLVNPAQYLATRALAGDTA